MVKNLPIKQETRVRSLGLEDPLESVCVCVVQMLKNLPAMQETGVQSLGWKDPLEKGTATHSCILACTIPRTDKPGRLQSMGSQSWSRLKDFHFPTFLAPGTCFKENNVSMD